VGWGCGAGAASWGVVCVWGVSQYRRKGRNATAVPQRASPAERLASRWGGCGGAKQPPANRPARACPGGGPACAKTNVRDRRAAPGSGSVAQVVAKASAAGELGLWLTWGRCVRHAATAVQGQGGQWGAGWGGAGGGVQPGRGWRLMYERVQQNMSMRSIPTAACA